MLYVILDILSYVVSWIVAAPSVPTCVSTALAERLITGTCAKENLQRGQLGIHADRGPAMTSKPVALLMGDLSVTKTQDFHQPRRRYPPWERYPE